MYIKKRFLHTYFKRIKNVYIWCRQKLLLQTFNIRFKNVLIKRF